MNFMVFISHTKNIITLCEVPERCNGFISHNLRHIRADVGISLPVEENSRSAQTSCKNCTGGETADNSADAVRLCPFDCENVVGVCAVSASFSFFNFGAFVDDTLSQLIGHGYFLSG